MRRIVNKLKPKSEFSRNVLTLMTGTIIAQAIPIAISPILTRIYSPEDFGVFALFIAITSIFGSVANGRYELAIMLPKKDEDAINILALGFIINVALTILLFLIVLFFHDLIIELVNNEKISTWLYFIPLSVFLMGCFNLLNYWNNRKKQYKDLAKAAVLKSISLAVVQLSIGFIKSGVFGLISGQIVSQIFANGKLIRNILNQKILKFIRMIKIIALGKKYKDFPLYSVGGAFVGTILAYLHILGIYFIYNAIMIGYVFLAQKLIQIPLGVISSSFSQVFYNKIANTSDINSLRELYLKSIYKLIYISILVLFVIYLIPNNIYIIFLGKNWTDIGDIIKILSIWFAVSFVSSSVSFIYTRLNKQKITFLFNILHLGVIIIFFLIAFVIKIDFIFFLEIYVFLKVIIYILSIVMALIFLQSDVHDK